MISDKKLARIAGFCYLLVIATGLFSEVFVRQALTVSTDALATAQNIKAHGMLFRWGFASDLFNFVIGLPTILIIYHIFKRVNKLLVQLALAFVIIQTAIIAVNLLNQISPLLILGNDPYLNTFQPNQLATLSLLSLKIQAQGYAIGLVFFGFYCLIIGYVLFKSNFLPKIFGILYALSGLCYLINSFTMFLSKGFENPIFLYLAIPIFIGELSFCLWLLIKGLDTSKHKIPNEI
ncbi:hypothetical protein H4V97_000120 [Flavobacterium sp. CG_23.5]|uniref:DUF4386 domain-containing protein n=1 Tax=unclassified Flavobacterium TaxID=196869 RepID=UPI0018C90584|nr:MULTISPECIES: DUF4386 domain-containing protein [unclassified Flavobacterium]MBG6110201.1 hypothetical protein [Flavobacterium sp. CG_9.10]MBP2281802.1 hypothetical protein [Flavobacterium sp. CG_23.5]